MTTIDSEGFWKILAISACALVVSAVVFWLTYGRELVTEAQVKEMIPVYSPYSADRQLLIQANTKHTTILEEQSKNILDLKVQMAKVEQSTNNLEKTVQKLTDRLETSVGMLPDNIKIVHGPKPN